MKKKPIHWNVNEILFCYKFPLLALYGGEEHKNLKNIFLLQLKIIYSIYYSTRCLSKNIARQARVKKKQTFFLKKVELLSKSWQTTVWKKVLGKLKI